MSDPQEVANLITGVSIVAFATIVAMVIIWLRFAPKQRVAVRSGFGAASAVVHSTAAKWPGWLPDIAFIAVVIAMNVLVHQLGFLEPEVFWFLVFVEVIVLGWWIKKKPLRILLWIVAVMMLIAYFQGAVLGVLGFADSRFNRGEWHSSSESDSVRFVRDQTINIPSGGYDRFEAAGRIRLVNQSRKQCMHPRPLTQHTWQTLDNGYIVREIGTNDHIYTMHWSADGWTYTIDIAPGRVETIEVTTIQLGQPDCQPVRL